jgi:hypothetical protein
MKRKSTSLYFLFLLLLLGPGCSKDFLKDYEDRIVGTWSLIDVNRQGFVYNSNSLPFTTGTFQFFSSGELRYTDGQANRFTGTWSIEKRMIGEEWTQSLTVAVFDPVTLRSIAEYYDDIRFTSTNRFTANVRRSFGTYVSIFRR